MKNLIIAKFGGSSMADAKAMKRSAAVTTNQIGTGAVLVSATYGTTNQLIKLAETAHTQNWEKCKPIIEDLRSKHFQIAKELGCGKETVEELESILNEAQMLARGINYLKDCSPKVMDSILSIGERSSSLLFTQAMIQVHPDKTIEWFDIRKVMRTDDQFNHAYPILSEIERLCNSELREKIDNGIIIVSQGFIGQTNDGHTTTLGRGGSDYSAALLAEGLNASTLQIWTDVAGIATTDPRICSEAKPLKELSFTEAAELATFGAKILHPTTVWPAMRKGIPIFVGSSIESELPGTWITNAINDEPLVRAVAIRDNQGILTISSPRMVHTHGYLHDIFKVFKDYKVSVDLVTTSEISVSVTVDNTTLNNKEMIAELEKLGKVEIENDYSLVSLIGNNINKTKGIAKDIFDSISDVNIRLTCQGASKHHFCFLVDKADASESVRSIHKRFLQ